MIYQQAESSFDSPNCVDSLGVEFKLPSFTSGLLEVRVRVSVNAHE